MNYDGLEPGSLWIARENRYQLGGVVFDNSACFQTFRGFTGQIIKDECFLLLSAEIIKPSSGRQLVVHCWSLRHNRDVWMNALDFSYLEQAA